MDHQDMSQMYQPREYSNGFITASLSLGVVSLILSIVCCFTVYLPLIAGALAILFALLSKGRTPQMHQNSKIGLIMGIASIIITICMLVFSFVMVFTVPELREEFQTTYEAIYGESFDTDLFQDF